MTRAFITALVMMGTLGSIALGFSVSSDQDIDSGGNIAGGGDSITPSGSDPDWHYDWTNVASPGLSLGSYKLYCDDDDTVQGSITLNLDGGNITGDDSSQIRTYIGSAGAYKSADHLVITNVGDIAMGGIDTHAHSAGTWNSQDTYAGDLTIGQSINLAGNIRIGFIHTYNGTTTHGDSRRYAGKVTIYSSGDVLIENAVGSARGDIRTHYWTGAHPTGADIAITHDGHFRVDEMLTYGDSHWTGGSAPYRTGDITLNGGTAIGHCVINAIDTSWNVGGYNCINGNVVISNYAGVTITNIYTDNDFTGPGGHITIGDIAGDIDIYGVIETTSMTPANDGNVMLSTAAGSGGNVTLGQLDLSKVKTIMIDADGKRSLILGDLLNFNTGDPADGGLDAPPGHAIFYSRTPTNNLYLGGDTYFLKSGGKLRSLAFGTVVIFK